MAAFKARQRTPCRAVPQLPSQTNHTVCQRIVPRLGGVQYAIIPTCPSAARDASTALTMARPTQPQTARACVVTPVLYPTVRTSTMHADETLM
jgi:hypothetical protein